MGCDGDYSAYLNCCQAVASDPPDAEHVLRVTLVGNGFGLGLSPGGEDKIDLRLHSFLVLVVGCQNAIFMDYHFCGLDRDGPRISCLAPRQ